MGKEDYHKIKHFVFTCNGKDCKANGAKEIGTELKKVLKEEGLQDSTKVIKTKCTGRCKEGPVVIIKENWLTEVRPKQVPEIINENLKGNGS